MRFAVICFMLLLLVTALASEQHGRPSSPPPYQEHPPPYREHPPPYLAHPPPPPQHQAPPRHGDFVRYQAPHGPHAGIALGERPDRRGNHVLAPLVPLDQQPQGRLAVHRDRIVKAHPGDIVTSRRAKPAPQEASVIMEGHARMRPQVSYASGPVHGSSNYISERGGHHRPGGSGSHGRN